MRDGNKKAKIKTAVCLSSGDGFVISCQASSAVVVSPPCSRSGVLSARIIQADVNFPQRPHCPPESVSCPDTHRHTRIHHLISGAAVIAESTICSDPACSEVGGATHLDPSLPILPLLLSFIYLFHFIPSHIWTPSYIAEGLTARPALQS